MDHGERLLLIVVHQRAVAKPVQELVPVGCLEYVLQIALLRVFRVPGSERQEVEVVVAQDHDRSFPQALHEA
jgi:hypothetical protein